MPADDTTTSPFIDWLNGMSRAYGYARDADLARALGLQQATVSRWRRQGARPSANNIAPDRASSIRARLDLKDGAAVFFVCGVPRVFAQFAAAARLRLGRELNLVREGGYEFCWVTDFPMYELNEETGQIELSHNPFSMPQGGLEALERLFDLALERDVDEHADRQPDRHRVEEPDVAPDDAPLLEMRGITKRFAGVVANDRIDFDVRRGEVHTLFGENGAGKSTLLKILSRITEPTEGRCEIHGRVGSLLEVGTGFHGELTGRENVYLNGAILGMKKCDIERKFDEIVAFAEVERFIDTPVKRYSSGMYVRLAFAVAAHLETEILVIDEVLSVGDLNFKRKCLGKLEDVARQGRTVLFVSHNIGAVSNLCTSGLCMEQGRSIRQGNIRSIVDFYIKRNTDSTDLETGRWKHLGTGEARIRSLRVLDLEGNLSSAFSMGQTVALD